MSRIKILVETEVSGNCVKVSTPLSTPILIIEGQTLYEAEMFFTRKCNMSVDHQTGIEFDRIRAIFRWASECGAIFVNMHHDLQNKALHMSFAFSEKGVEKFCTDTNRHVEMAMVKR